jgi:hypothetical protein
MRLHIPLVIGLCALSACGGDSSKYDKGVVIAAMFRAGMAPSEGTDKAADIYLKLCNGHADLNTKTAIRLFIKNGGAEVIQVISDVCPEQLEEIV